MFMIDKLKTFGNIFILNINLMIKFSQKFISFTYFDLIKSAIDDLERILLTQLLVPLNSTKNVCNIVTHTLDGLGSVLAVSGIATLRHKDIYFLTPIKIV